ncbi:MAG: L-serine ammonia-lyase, iron-sulfur-dependent subunit beta [Clostridiales Family XIII bacterium]|jgi:L-serine dehydratase|nr:L-serine ammonia-lyase, iron-sulfur-dependent subunit beta [Clostridiales Family XIII bacterium]
MRNYSAFDIIGPVMVGPSSSHTAGAARLGKIAKLIAGVEIKHVQFMLHGSFAQTWKGHGTDKALVAGILGMDPWDARLKDSLEMAAKQGIGVEFSSIDLGDVSPNTVKIVVTGIDGVVTTVVGSSIGGGNVVVIQVDGDDTEFTGTYPTLLVHHTDMPGMILKVCEVLYARKVNIVSLKVFRSARAADASMVFELDEALTEREIEAIREIPNIKNAKAINL